MVSFGLAPMGPATSSYIRQLAEESSPSGLSGWKQRLDCLRAGPETISQTEFFVPLFSSRNSGTKTNHATSNLFLLIQWAEWKKLLQFCRVRASAVFAQFKRFRVLDRLPFFFTVKRNQVAPKAIGFA